MPRAKPSSNEPPRKGVSSCCSSHVVRAEPGLRWKRFGQGTNSDGRLLCSTWVFYTWKSDLACERRLSKYF